jgi:4-hydroxy-3-methylbut-2-enyl diphosphate reductase
MKILRAEYLGFCFGVRDALALAKTEVSRVPLTVLGELVHNESVLADLSSRGVRVEEDLKAVKTATVLITAHGASERRFAEVRQREHTIVDATCPLVRHAHRQLAGLVQAGFHPVVIGKQGHVEVRGLMEDFDACDVVLSESDIDQLARRPRFGVVAQTTQPITRVRSLVDYLRHKFPSSEVKFRDTVCQPTKQRQTAVENLAPQCDVVIVIGGANSNNTRQLVATCRHHCRRVYHIQLATDLKDEWFLPNDTVGLTAGTSTPDSVIEAVESVLQRIARLRQRGDVAEEGAS